MSADLTRLAGLVDAHCHLDLYPDPVKILHTADRYGIHILAVTNAPFVFPHTAALARNSRFVCPAVGLHPELADSHGHQVDELVNSFRTTRFVGEVGLDYGTPDRAVRTRQRKILARVVESCDASSVVSVHSRRAASDVIAAFGSDFPGKVIMHWFTGTEREVDRAVENGFYFSANPQMVRAGHIGKVVERIPRDKMLTESDGPLARVRRNPAVPQDVAIAVEGLAELWRVTFEEAKRIILSNWIRVTDDVLER